MKVCLIGSTRFREEFVEVNQELTRRGHLVYSVAFYKEPTKVDEHTKEVLDLVHLQKISESDVVVLITDKEGYIGDSTRREVIWAQLENKEIVPVQYGPEGLDLPDFSSLGQDGWAFNDELVRSLRETKSLEKSTEEIMNRRREEEEEEENLENSDQPQTH